MTRATEKTCTACGKKLVRTEGNDSERFNCSTDCLRAFGISPIPNSGWHWYENTRTGERSRMYPICEECWNKLEEIRKARKRVVKGKVVTAKH